jgi:hypothetical protein
MKEIVLLKMDGLDNETGQCDPRETPKKCPVLVDDDEVVPNTSLFRKYIEKTYGRDFDTGLPEAQCGVAWALAELCEDNIYWSMILERWLVEENSLAGPVVFFRPVPNPMPPIIVAVVRRQIHRDLWGQCFGRHARG